MQINRELDNIKAQIIKHYQHLSDRKAFVTAEMVRNSYQGFGSEYETLLNAFDKDIASLKKRVGKDRVASTLWAMQRSRKDVADFDKASRLIGKALSLMDLKDTVIVCIPASCQRTYSRRFRNFSAKVSAMCGAIDGFEHIHVIGKREKVHICGEYAAEDNVWIDEDFFKGKRILLIDDICTSARTSDAFKERMESAGAHVRMAMFLAKTKNYRRTNKYQYN